MFVKWNALFADCWKNCANVPPARAGPEKAQLTSVANIAAIKNGTRNIFIDVVSFNEIASLLHRDSHALFAYESMMFNDRY
jgi:hypothetical protein